MNALTSRGAAYPDSAPLFSLSTTSLECFVEANDRHLLPLEVSPLTPAFCAQLRGRALLRSWLVDIASSPVRVARTPRLAAQTSGDHLFKLVWQLHGGALMSQGGQTIRLAPGKMTIYRLSSPYRLHTYGEYRALMLRVDLADMPEWRRLAERCEGLAIPVDAAAYAALAALRVQLRRDSDPSVAQVEDAALELVFGSLWRYQREQLYNAPMPSERLTQARRMVLERLADTLLAPEDLAYALNISVRGLYEEFRRYRMAPPAAFIRELRLEQCYLALLDTALQQCSITHIALEHGFSDGAHFARVFRKRYGVSPGDLRARRKHSGLPSGAITASRL
ncbi:helix-turn-helix domain-containing protein [Halomonas sp. ISL-60]|uniref:helix-turn-helix domain-containing protein n=1 Tax=Halomonas sp. ISL-56 TaxID=2819149 RepID=UPI001BE6F97F|nr:helix-turn-helix domain-containing protein [Halomonas sp. ISL-56]MBT2772332.1 helix-turn-helix domain-containing protein [Halomonas sp. ISL-60]MBT2800769.1 helix-turn-helix domain-containing protein [Halomonas sp. ISL-56]